MNATNDSNYQHEANTRLGYSWMVNLYCALAWGALGAAVLELPVLALIHTQCITLEGISTGGKRYQTDSLTCPNHTVAPLWSRAR